MECYAFRGIIFVLRAVWEKMYCLTVCSRNCVRVTVTVSDCVPQLADRTECVQFSSAWLRSRVLLEVFHLWDLPLSAQCSSTLIAPVHMHFFCCCIQTRLKKMFHFSHHNHTTAQWIQHKITCVLCRALLSYKISDELDVDVLGEWYDNHRVWSGLSCFGKDPFFVFLKHYKLLRYERAGNVMVVFSKKDLRVNAVRYGSNTLWCVLGW